MLRQYQIDILEKSRSLMAQGVKSICIQSPTGSGKTVLSAHMIKSALALNNRIWFLTHRRELIKQVFDCFTAEKINCGIVCSGFFSEPLWPVQICSVQSLSRRMDKLQSPNLIIYDECHHIAANSWKQIHSKNPSAFHIGLSATPQRLDGKGLSDFFDKMVEGPTIQWLIANGYLSDYRIYKPSRFTMDGVKIKMGEFDRVETERRVNTFSIVGDVVSEYQKKALGKRTIVFCHSVNHSIQTANAFNGAGISAVHIGADTPEEERISNFEKFKKGEILVLTNVDIAGEGVDVPAVECVILLRPTNSTALYLQQVGRGLRPSPGKKETIILDHVGNYLLHGLPDMVRQWKLEGNKPAANRDVYKNTLMLCPKCFSAQLRANKCKYCDAFIEHKERSTKIKYEAGELIEVNKDQARIQMPQWSAKTIEDLARVGRARGYAHPEKWAAHVIAYRNRKAQ
ncbi:MAG: DEAD/DEAH box helicase [Rhabdochlamydiaceae bacterium]